MRFVFSVERNRKVFKRLFPPALFAAFIDVGHYKQDLGVYRVLARQWRALTRESARDTAAALGDIDHGGVARVTRVTHDHPSP
jgi:NIMA (never in mitosis gene a)-related kinase